MFCSQSLSHAGLPGNISTDTHRIVTVGLWTLQYRSSYQRPSRKLGVSSWPQTRAEITTVVSTRDPEVSRNEVVEEKTPRNARPWKVTEILGKAMIPIQHMSKRI